MPETTRIPEDRLSGYFDDFTKRFLRDSPAAKGVDVEVVAGERGDQRATETARLLGVTYDRHSNALEFSLDSGDHRIFAPREVWTVEEPDGFVSAIEVVKDDGEREVMTVKRVGLRSRD
jgi:hypothetical protein